jgi:hypothetical protein
MGGSNGPALAPQRRLLAPPTPPSSSCTRAACRRQRDATPARHASISPAALARRRIQRRGKALAAVESTWRGLDSAKGRVDGDLTVAAAASAPAVASSIAQRRTGKSYPHVFLTNRMQALGRGLSAKLKCHMAWFSLKPVNWPFCDYVCTYCEPLFCTKFKMKYPQVSWSIFFNLQDWVTNVHIQNKLCDSRCHLLKKKSFMFYLYQPRTWDEALLILNSRPRSPLSS